jgi:hypothetical protein
MGPPASAIARRHGDPHGFTLDGGLSFDTLDSGCRDLINGVATAIDVTRDQPDEGIS